jgi:hypothetical protein
MLAAEQIRLSREMKEWLDSLRIDPRQSYDSILRNLRLAIAKRPKKNGA